MATGVMLMTFGSAETSAGVPNYLRSVRGGSEPTAEVVAEFERRYALIGRSPLLDITDEQSDGLQRLLDSANGTGKFHVEVGMLHSAPSVASAMARLVAHCDYVIGIILSPQYSPHIMSGYGKAFGDALRNHSIQGHVAGAWHTLPSFHSAITEQLRAALAPNPEIPIVFTAHSLPQRVVKRDPAYINALHDTATAIAQRAEVPSGQWQFAYQSAGHTPEEWLRPDFTELLPALRAAGHAEVLVVPTQFVADHLEVLYDIDIAGAAEAEALGMTLLRTRMPNASARFIRVLADVVARECTDVRLIGRSKIARTAHTET